MFSIRLCSFFALCLFGVGCSGATSSSPPPAPVSKAPVEEKKIVPVVQLTQEDKEIAEERAKLSPEDRALVNAQEWCIVSNEARLGEMGVPIKLMVGGKPVFICCKGCKKEAEADPEKTLAKLEELKAKAKAAKP